MTRYYLILLVGLLMHSCYTAYDDLDISPFDLDSDVDFIRLDSLIAVENGSDQKPVRFYFTVKTELIPEEKDLSDVNVIIVENGFEIREYPLLNLPEYVQRVGIVGTTKCYSVKLKEEGVASRLSESHCITIP